MITGFALIAAHLGILSLAFLTGITIIEIITTYPTKRDPVDLCMAGWFSACLIGALITTFAMPWWAP